MKATAEHGLTTTKAPFIEKARADGRMYIDQPYELYSDENQQAWRSLFARMQPRWERYAHPKFLEGLDNLALDPDNVPRLEDINKFLEPRTQFIAKAVSGFIPGFIFFDCLANREFPTTITIRDPGKLDYLPEPDIFHDVAGHVPMHTHSTFADVLVRFGTFARRAAQYSAEIKNEELRTHATKNIIKALGRFFWFSIEFGLMRRDKNSLCVYGSGILSSYGEVEYAIDSPDAWKIPFQLDWVVNQYFEIDTYQPLYFYVESFEHLYDQIDALEKLMLDGKLNTVAHGYPEVSDEDIQSFFDAQV